MVGQEERVGVAMGRSGRWGVGEEGVWVGEAERKRVRRALIRMVVSWALSIERGDGKF